MSARQSSSVENVFAMGSIKQSVVWQKVSALHIQINKLSEKLIEDEPFGLGEQVQETIASIVSNMAAGDGPRSEERKKYGLALALTASLELETHLVVLRDLEIVAAYEIRPMLEELMEIRELLKEEIQQHA